MKEWEQYGLLINDKNLSNWVNRAAEVWITESLRRQFKHLSSGKSPKSRLKYSKAI